MSAPLSLTPTESALLRVLAVGSVTGVCALAERAVGRVLRDDADLDLLCDAVGAVRSLIARGMVAAKPRGSTARFRLTRVGRRALRERRGEGPRKPLGWSVGVVALAAGLAGCASPQPTQPRALLMGHPVLTGLAQVRDPQTGTDYFVPCSPCAAPTPKTAVLVGDADDLPVPGGSARVVRDVSPAITPAATPITTTTASTPTPASHSLPFARASAALSDEGRARLAALLPLASKAERVYIRGRTDVTGTAQGNRALAIARAAAVRVALVRAGLDPRKLTVSYCTTCFVAPNDSEAGRSANRRVDIELVMPSAATAGTAHNKAS